MIDKLFTRRWKEAADAGRRLVAPLAGFPGLNLTGGTVKLAQQNFGEHFRALRALADAVEPDVVFPMMDLSVEANALGRYTVFPKEDSATVVKDEFSHAELERARSIVMSYDSRVLAYVETLKLMKIGLAPSIIKGAYVIGPYSLAGLLIGAEEAAMESVMNPDGLHRLCDFTTQKILEYVRLLVAAGADLLCVLEPSAVMLGPEQFGEFSGRYVANICANLMYTDVAAVYHICGNSMHLIEAMCAAGVEGLSLDSPETGVDLPEAARRAGGGVAVIGNVSPVGRLLRGTREEVEAEVAALLKTMEPFPNFVLSTGCDLPQETPLENIKAFMRAGRGK